LVSHVFIFRVYLIFVNAVTLILKCATLLQTSNLQQYTTTCTLELSAEQFADFIMATDIVSSQSSASHITLVQQSWYFEEEEEEEEIFMWREGSRL